MKNTSKGRFAQLSRRVILRTAALAGASTAILGPIIGREGTATAQTKVPKTVVGYQDTPHDGQRCDNCLQFEPPSACKVVEGNVAPAGWCKVYVKKPS